MVTTFESSLLVPYLLICIGVTVAIMLFLRHLHIGTYTRSSLVRVCRYVKMTWVEHQRLNLQHGNLGWDCRYAGRETSSKHPLRKLEILTASICQS